MSSTLLGASLILYFLASALYLTNLHLKKQWLSGYAAVLACSGLAVQTVRLVYNAAQTGSLFATPQEALFFLSWAITVAFVITVFRFKIPALGALVMPIALIALALVFRFPAESGTKLPGGWISIHLYSILISMALFVIAFACAVFYLIQNRLLKSKKLRGMFRRLPPLEMVDSLAYHLAAIGFPLLTLGIITGVVGVRAEKLTSAVSPIRIIAAGLAWIIYATYLFARNTAHWRGKRSSWILIAGTIAIATATLLHRFFRI